MVRIKNFALIGVTLFGVLGCAPKKPAKAQPPAGYVQNGFCIPEAIDRYGDPTILRCKQNDGKVFVYKR